MTTGGKASIPRGSLGEDGSEQRRVAGSELLPLSGMLVLSEVTTKLGQLQAQLQSLPFRSMIEYRCTQHFARMIIQELQEVLSLAPSLVEEEETQV